MGNQKDAFLVFDLKDAEGIIQQRKRSSKVDDPEEVPVVPADTPQQVKAIPVYC